MNIIVKGKIEPRTIYHVKFTANEHQQLKCTSSNTYIADAIQFAEQFKKEKINRVEVEILQVLGTEHKSFTEQ